MSPIARPYSRRPTWRGVEVEAWTDEVVTAAASRAAQIVRDAGVTGAPGEAPSRADALAAVEAAGVLRQLAESVEAYALQAARADALEGGAPRLSWDEIARASGYAGRSTAQRRYKAAIAPRDDRPSS